MTTIALSTTKPAARRPAGDLRPGTRAFLATGGALLFALTLWALGRAVLGIAPGAAALKEVALAIHLATVVPAIPLGACVFLRRKGSANHKLLGKIWLALMVVGAVSAMGIRHLNGGSLSWIHLFVPLVLVTAWRAISSARAGNIAKHKRVLLGMFVGALLIPGLAAFAPGRLMWVWVFN